MQALGESAVRGDADRLALGGVDDAVGMLIPVRFPQAEPVHAATLLAISIQVAQRPLGVAVLPGVDAHLFAAAQKLHDALGRVPVGHRAAQDAIEVRVAVDRIAADDEAGDVVGAEADRRQRLRRRLSGGRAVRQDGAGGEAGGRALKKLAASAHDGFLRFDSKITRRAPQRNKKPPPRDIAREEVGLYRGGSYSAGLTTTVGGAGSALDLP